MSKQHSKLKKGKVALFFDGEIVAGDVLFSARKVMDKAVFDISLVKQLPARRKKTKKTPK